MTGGFDSAGVITSTVYFAPISATNSVGAWATTTPLPRGTYSHSAVVNNGFIYTTGGLDDAGFATSTVYFAPITATSSVGAWATTTPLPQTRYIHGVIVNNGYIYTIGGYNGVPTSTNFSISAASRDTYWGLTAPNGTATGTYTGTNTFTAVFQP
jgi:enamine deaminase RidA (YjgF/YER057c/UK114 family)